MSATPLDQLSDQQKDCLRLLFANLSVKEIGKELNVSPNTIKGRLKSARRLVGTDTSMKAAIMLVQYERDTLGVDPPRSIGLERQLADESSATLTDLPERVARNRNAFGALPRIALIVIIAFGTVALAGGLAMGSEVIKRVVHAERIEISDYP